MTRSDLICAARLSKAGTLRTIAVGVALAYATGAAAAPGVPGTPTFSDVRPDVVTVGWTPASGASSYDLLRARDAAFTQDLIVLQATSPYQDRAVVPDTTYHYRVRAVSATGTTLGAASFVTMGLAPPAAPALTYDGRLSITATWPAVLGAATYELHRATDAAFSQDLAVFPCPLRIYADSGLSASTTYHYRVATVNSAGKTAGAAASLATRAPRTLTITGGGQPAGGRLGPPGVDNLVGHVVLTAPSEGVVLTSLELGSSGTTGAAPDVQELRLVDESTGATVASTAGDGTLYRFTGLSYSVAGSRVLQVVLVLASTLGAGATFELTVAASAATVLAPDDVIVTPFSGHPFSVVDYANGPVLRIVNPASGAVVSPSPQANAFRVQVYVFDPLGVGALSPVQLSTDGGATWPITLVRSPRYFSGDDFRSLWETTVSTLASGGYTLRARVANSAGRQALANPVAITVGLPRRGDGYLLVRDRSGQLCVDCHAIATHSSEVTSSRYGSWSTDCLDCHTTHLTPNIFLIRPQITPPPVNGVLAPRTVRFSATTGDTTSLAPYAATYANPDNSGPCQVCHTRTSDPTASVPRFRSTGNLDTHWTATSYGGPKRCTTCHRHEYGFGVHAPP